MPFIYNDIEYNQDGSYTENQMQKICIRCSEKFYMHYKTFCREGKGDFLDEANVSKKILTKECACGIMRTMCDYHKE